MRGRRRTRERPSRFFAALGMTRREREAPEFGIRTLTRRSMTNVGLSLSGRGNPGSFDSADSAQDDTKKETPVAMTKKIVRTTREVSRKQIGII